jgi:hypothetical protein
MIFHGIDGEFPVVLMKFNEPLGKPYDVLEMYILVHHAVAHEQMSFETFCKIDGGASVVGQAIGKRFVQDGGGIAVVVMGPVGDRPEACSCCEYVGLGEEGHEGDESAVGASVDAYSFGVYALVFYQVFYAIHLVGEVFSSHMAIDAGAPISAIACTASVIDVEDGVAIVSEQVVEHIFPEVAAPPFMGILEIACPVDENDGRMTGGQGAGRGPGG